MILFQQFRGFRINRMFLIKYLFAYLRRIYGADRVGNTIDVSRTLILQMFRDLNCGERGMPCLSRWMFQVNDVGFHNSGRKIDLCTACVLYGFYKKGRKYIKWWYRIHSYLFMGDEKYCVIFEINLTDYRHLLQNCLLDFYIISPVVNIYTVKGALYPKIGLKAWK